MTGGRVHDLRGWACVLLAALLLAGCPGKHASRKREPPKPCTSFGDTCEVAPGKLGTCVQHDDCSTTNCFVCQSQH